MSLSHGFEGNAFSVDLFFKALGTLQSHLILPLTLCDGSHPLPHVLRINSYKQSTSQDSQEIPPFLLRRSYFFRLLRVFAVRGENLAAPYLAQMTAAVKMQQNSLKSSKNRGQQVGSPWRCSCLHISGAVVSLLDVRVWLCLLSSRQLTGLAINTF